MQTRAFQVVACFELAGCALLLAAQIAGALQGYAFTPGYLAGVAAALVLTASAGILLLRGRDLGRQLSVAVQALQVINLSTAAFSYQVALGPVARLRIQPDGWLTQFGAYGTAAAAFGPLLPTSPEYTVNVVALVALVLLLRTRSAVHATSLAPVA
jgi:hypothetical protein